MSEPNILIDYIIILILIDYSYKIHNIWQLRNNSIRYNTFFIELFILLNY